MSDRSPAPVLRRRSPVDPVPGTWAVLGLGAHGAAVIDRLAAARVPVLGYDRRTGTGSWPARWGHHVVALDEIEDVDLLAVTSQDIATGEINTDYFTGVVIATGADVPAFVDPELLNALDTVPRLAHRTFTPRHPAVLVAFTDTPELLALQADVVAAYATALTERPRQALWFHRRICAPIIPGWPQQPRDPDAAAPLPDLLRADRDALAGLAAPS